MQRRAHYKKHLLPILLSYLFLFGAMVGASSACADPQAEASFFCGTDRLGVFRGESGRVSCPGSSNAEANSQNKKAMCMYRGVCVPANDGVRSAVEYLTGKKIHDLNDDEINRAVMRAGSNPAIAAQLNSSGIKLSAADIMCLSGNDGQCPKINACLNMKNGGAFAWGFVQEQQPQQQFPPLQDKTQGFTLQENGNQAPLPINRKPGGQ